MRFINENAYRQCKVCRKMYQSEDLEHCSEDCKNK